MKNHFQKYKLIYIGVLILINIFIWYVVIQKEKAVLTVVFLAVGQGDSIFIEAPNGNQILIDGGADKKVLRELGKVLPFYDRSINMIIATHPDKDHIGGLPDILKRYKVETFLESGVESNTGTYRTLKNILQNNNVDIVTVENTMTIVLDEDITLEILFPDRDAKGLESNTASIVSRLVYGETEFLFTGDSPKNIESYLVSRISNNLESDVLKVGHHGSRTSTSEQFLAIVNPEYAIISAGENNQYGHPNIEVINLLEQFEIKILSTIEEKTIIFKSNGVNLKIY